MEFNLKNPMAAVKNATEVVTNIGLQTTREVLEQINSLLKLLQSAGYGVNNLDIELSLPPRVTVKLKTTAALKEEKLEEILQSHRSEKVIAAVVASLIQANKLRASITVETLALDGVEIILTTAPNITLQWADRDALAA